MEMNALPALTGTEKQIAYATDIRNAVILQRELAEFAVAENAGRKPGPRYAAEVAEMTARIGWESTDATYWIRRFRPAAINRTREQWMEDEERQQLGWTGFIRRYTSIMI